MAVNPGTGTDPVPADKYPNKAIIAALMVVAIVVRQWVDSHEFDWSEEGIATLIGAIGTLLVWAQSNWKRLGRLF